MIQLIDDLLNKISMYKLVYYYLIGLLVVAAVYGAFGILPYSWDSIVFSSLFLVAVCWAFNNIFAKTFNAPVNVESFYISALILALIVAPARDFHGYVILFWAGALAMATKYILAIRKKHIFNPVAVSAVLTAMFLGASANWWVGTLAMLPFVLIGGFLTVRKVQRYDLVFTFLIVSLAATFLLSIFKGSDLITVGKEALCYSPLFFFAFVMLTEPLTTPPTKKLQVWYGALVGILFAPQVHFGGFYTTPEIALVMGNIYSYIVSPKQRLLLKLKQTLVLAPGIADFVFASDQKFKFKPGQYLEWTLGHENPDNRGNRRYFTIASSPTENDIRIGVKFYEQASSFKRALADLKSGDVIAASQLAGDFVLPDDFNEKCVFIAGGIGITPFRSMIKYLIDTGQKRDVVLIYVAKSEQEIVYSDIFEQAAKQLGIRVYYYVGRITPEIVMDKIPQYQQRTFYISGPRSMVVNFENSLKALNLKGRQIKKDFFPGLV